MQGFLIRFNNEFLDSTSPLDRTNIYSISNKRLNQLTLSAKEAREFEALLKLLFKEFSETRHPSKDEILRNLLIAFLLKLEIKTHENQVQKLETANENDETIYLKFLQLVELNYQKEKQIEFYTDKLIISPRKLSDITKRIAGKPAKQIIVDRLILATKRILTFTNKSLKETAYWLGFEEIAYFCRLFKKYTGLTPTEYKAKAAKPVTAK
jgi:AraC family transcriptional regulator, transcriptional activator of pobA